MSKYTELENILADNGVNYKGIYNQLLKWHRKHEKSSVKKTQEKCARLQEKTCKGAPSYRPPGIVRCSCGHYY